MDFKQWTSIVMIILKPWSTENMQLMKRSALHEPFTSLLPRLKGQPGRGGGENARAKDGEECGEVLFSQTMLSLWSRTHKALTTCTRKTWKEKREWREEGNCRRERGAEREWGPNMVTWVQSCTAEPVRTWSRTCHGGVNSLITFIYHSESSYTQIPTSFQVRDFFLLLFHWTYFP